jgi:hypothetical protein
MWLAPARGTHQCALLAYHLPEVRTNRAPTWPPTMTSTGYHLLLAGSHQSCHLLVVEQSCHLS